MPDDRVITQFIWIPTYLPSCVLRFESSWKWLVNTKVRQRKNVYNEWIDICWEE